MFYYQHYHNCVISNNTLILLLYQLRTKGLANGIMIEFDR